MNRMRTLSAARRLRPVVVFVALAWLGLGSSARAALGGDAASIDADRIHMAATVASTVYAGYTAYVLTLPNHGIVNEYLDAQGQVFAISWRGPGRPDLRQLLGARFDTMQSDNAPGSAHPRRRRSPMTVKRADFVMHNEGRPGAFGGAAYLPQAVPAGFSLSDIE